jgi:hypothetical protein
MSPRGRPTGRDPNRGELEYRVAEFIRESRLQPNPIEPPNLAGVSSVVLCRRP